MYECKCVWYKSWACLSIKYKRFNYGIKNIDSVAYRECMCVIVKRSAVFSWVFRLFNVLETQIKHMCASWNLHYIFISSKHTSATYQSL